MSYETNYVWFSRLARILEEVEKIPGSEEVIPRLGIAEEYWNALNELDFALKIRVAGIQCNFVSRTLNPTPDLALDYGAGPSFVEITSLNTSEKERIAMDTEIWLSSEQFRRHCHSGGSIYWDHPDFVYLSDKIRETVREAFDEAIDSKQLVHKNIPGIFDFYAVPEEQAELMPKRWANSFQMSARTPLPIKDRISRKIDEKTQRQLSSDNSSILVFYDRISSEAVRLLSDDHNIAVKIATFPNLAAVLLVHPITNPFAVSNIKDDIATKWDLTVINHKLPNGEGEECLLWENSEEKGYSETTGLLKECLAKYPANLARLLEQ